MNRRHIPIAVIAAGLLIPAPAYVAEIGRNTPAQSITADRIATLPAGDRAAWQAYLERSQAQMRADKAALAAELKPGEAAPPQPEAGHASEKTMPLDRDSGWYATPEARHAADIIVSFQTPAGGWSKNQPRTGALRLPGQPYAADNVSKLLSADDYDMPKDIHWNYVGTLDNDATITEMRFLARVSTAVPGKDGDTYRASFLRGVDYLLAAQFPNGCWPQVYPLEGGYHDAITYNDNAVVQAAEVLTDVAKGEGDYAFVPAGVRQAARGAEDRAIACILATQLVVNGHRTVWGQQHDALTLRPVSGRNYEPPELASSESGDLLLYLMSLPDPSPAVVAAVNDGVAWLKAAAIYNVAYSDNGDRASGRRLIAKPRAGPLWSRYYASATGRPVFGDRDKSLHDNVNDLSLERRKGYSWFNNGPKKALEAYPAWHDAHP